MYIPYSRFISWDKYFADSLILVEKLILAETNFEESFRLATPITHANIIIVIVDTFSYGLYKDVLEASVGESLRCKREAGNPHDSYAVSVLKGKVIVGHVPRFVSSIYLSYVFTQRWCY